MVDGLEGALGPGLENDDEAQGTSHIEEMLNAAASDTNHDLSTVIDLPTSTNKHDVTKLPQSLQRVYIQLSSLPEPCCVLFDRQQVVCRSKELEIRDERVVVLGYNVERGGESIVDIARREVVGDGRL